MDFYNNISQIYLAYKEQKFILYLYISIQHPRNGTCLFLILHPQKASSCVFWGWEGHSYCPRVFLLRALMQWPSLSNFVPPNIITTDQNFRIWIGRGQMNLDCTFQDLFCSRSNSIIRTVLKTNHRAPIVILYLLAVNYQLR